MVINQRKEKISLALIFLFIIIVNYFFFNLIMGIISAILLLVSSLVGIKRYSSCSIKDEVKVGKGLVILSSIMLIISLIWILLILLNLFILLVFI